MTPAPKLDPYLSPPLVGPDERAERAESVRAMLVLEKATDILESPQLLYDAITAAMDDPDMAVALKKFAHWYAEKVTPPVSIFHKPQAD